MALDGLKPEPVTSYNHEKGIRGSAEAQSGADKGKQLPSEVFPY